jgi:hypothetical protein
MLSNSVETTTSLEQSSGATSKIIPSHKYRTKTSPISTPILQGFGAIFGALFQSVARHAPSRPVILSFNSHELCVICAIFSKIMLKYRTQNSALNPLTERVL